MMIWCSHKWSEDSRYFNQPNLPSDLEFKGTHQDTLLKVMHGSTTVVLHCLKCGDLKSLTLIGDASKKKSV